MLTRNKMDPWPGPLSMWSLHTLPMSGCVFSRYSGFLSCCPDVHVGWIGVSEVSQAVCVWACVSGPEMEGCAIQSGSPFVPRAAGIDWGHPWPWTGISGWQKNDLPCFMNVSQMCVWVTFISMLTIRSVWGLYKFCDVFVTRNMP